MKLITLIIVLLSVCTSSFSQKFKFRSNEVYGTDYDQKEVKITRSSIDSELLASIPESWLMTENGRQRESKVVVDFSKDRMSFSGPYLNQTYEIVEYIGMCFLLDKTYWQYLIKEKDSKGYAIVLLDSVSERVILWTDECFLDFVGQGNRLKMVEYGYKKLTLKLEPSSSGSSFSESSQIIISKVDAEIYLNNINGRDSLTLVIFYVRYDRDNYYGFEAYEMSEEGEKTGEPYIIYFKLDYSLLEITFGENNQVFKATVLNEERYK